MNPQFWRGKRVLITGHTGFKGSWLSLWLQRSGAAVAGYALPPAVDRSLYELASVGDGMSDSVYDDIRSATDLQTLLDRFRPEIVFHLAAQALVRLSYVDPVSTFQTNVIGTAHLLEAIKRCDSCRAVVVITSDKCYENQEWPRAYRETDALGGHDPYSSSKACAELVTSAFRRSFFDSPGFRPVAVATARAGNVIGGGDFAQDRLVPDIMAAIQGGRPLQIRYPDAIRPWQHVLEPLAGYMLLAEKLWEDPHRFARSWNFGPSLTETQPVRWVVGRLSALWGADLGWEPVTARKSHEAGMLMLDSALARAELGWRPHWTLDRALQSIVEWYRAYDQRESLHDKVMQDIVAYEGGIVQHRADRVAETVD
jgi:CDP-glucose 4,6-dehydratase